MPSLPAVALLLTLSLGVFLTWRQLDQPVRAVRVQGSLSEAEQRAVREAVGPFLVQGLLSLDLDALTENILALSWPRDVRLRRAWPDGLIISVDRELLVATWGADGYLTSVGKIVHLPDLAEELPVLRASIASPRQAMEVYQMLQKELDVSGLKIRQLQESPLGEWQLTLENGLTLALGNDYLAERTHRFLTVYHEVLRQEQQGELRVDARYGNGVAVSRTTPLLALEAALP
jgi:cell division protein FtsQ